MDDEYSGEQQRPSGHGHHQASTTELMANAKYLASAAQSAAGGKTSSIDKAKAASAAEEFLRAAQQYGKFDEASGIGKYVGKAEDYLHKYHSSDSQNTGARREDEAPNRRHERREEGEDYGREEGGGRRHERRDDDEGYGREEGEGRRHERRDDDEGYGREENEDRRHQNRRQEEDEEETGSGGGSGVGEYINMAKGFFK